MVFSRRALMMGAAAAALLATTVFTGPVLAAGEYVANIGHLEAPTQPRHRGLEKVAALVEERTGGEVQFKLFPASQLGNARQMVEGTQFGSMQGTVMPAAFLGGFNPVVSILDVPFVMPADRAKAQELRGGPFGEMLLDSFSSRGLTAIGLWPNGRKSVTSSKPISTPDAFKGQKFRVMDSNILMAQFAGVGASAIAIPFSELYTALQTGMVDGQENPLDTIATMKFHEVQKHLVVSDHGAMEDVILFNPTWWNGLPEGHREVIVEAFEEVRPEVERMKEEAQVQALDALRKGGMEEHALDDAQRAAWREQMYPPAREAYLQRAGAEGQKAVEVYEAELKRLGL
ncbi:TRAP transporter substrate-binding protein [Arenibaculum sp.]|uniref:TRAP transporter substrate-binding protein n=1 Tax=Arenibaculum sp. TaxID=2865862 RepID=UPI002E0D1658|nr:TRAP transporter substrate-binding protein [Arenibaculum sp.]